jgi:hemerythrin superfamily protein
MTATTSKASGKEKTDAVSILTADHKKVKKLFKDFEGLKESGSDAEKEELVAEICQELTIHADAEEQIFYPAAREGIEESDLLDEAEVEHASVRELVSQLESMSADDDLYDAKVKVLAEYVDHHVEEEQNEIFPKVKKAKLDLEGLGEQILEFKEMMSPDNPVPPTKTERSKSSRTSI